MSAPTILRAALFTSLAAAACGGCDGSSSLPPPKPTTATADARPEWLRRPGDAALVAFQRRLLDPRDDVRKAAVAEWEAARVAAKGIDWSAPEPPLRAPAETPPTFGQATRALRDALLAALRDGDVPTRVAAATSLGEMCLPVGKELTQAIADPAAEVRVAAARAVSSLASFQSQYPACLPAMRKLLGDPDWRARAAGARGVSTYAGTNSEYKAHHEGEEAVTRLLELASDEHAEVRDAALCAIESVRPWRRDAEVESTFAHALNDASGDVQGRAARWFGHEADRRDAKPLPPPIVATLRGMLTSPDTQVRRWAAFAVWNATRESAGVVPVFAEGLVDRRGPNLVGALRSLAEIGPDAESAVPAIVSALSVDTSSRFGSGAEAIEALSAIGPSAATTIPLLAPMLGDPDPVVRWKSAAAIATLDGDPAACDAVLARALVAERHDTVRGAIHRARGAIGADGDAVVADLVSGLVGPEDECAGAIDGLKALGSRAATALPDLEKLVASESKSWTKAHAATAVAVIGGPVRAAAMIAVAKGDGGDDAVRVLERAGPADVAAVPALLEHLDESPIEIARALAGIGPSAKSALPALDRLLARTSPQKRIAAAEAVLRIDVSRDDALKILVDAVEKGAARREDEADDDLATTAAYALFRAGDAARPAVPALRKAMARRGLELQAAAAFALMRLTGETDACIDVIVATIDDFLPSPPIRLVEALGETGPPAARAVPALERIASGWQREWSKESEAAVTRAAIVALGRIGPGAASALPSLRKLRRNALFRAAAEAAIHRIEAK